jgi:hypothetical protein
MLPNSSAPAGPYDLRLGATPHPYYDSVDVFITLTTSNTTYRATFYTFAKVLGLMEEYRTTGQNCNGLYFVPPSWILLKNLSEATILLTVEDLIEGGFGWVFKAVESETT